MRRESGAAGDPQRNNPARKSASPPLALPPRPPLPQAQHATYPNCLFRVVPRRKLDSVAKRGVGLAYACMWMPAWGDCCIDDPAGVPVGEMRLLPDIAGGPPPLPGTGPAGPHVFPANANA
jgi:hypothetical protein